jgi:hypothetical protein
MSQIGAHNPGQGTTAPPPAHNPTPPTNAGEVLSRWRQMFGTLEGLSLERVFRPNGPDTWPLIFEFSDMISYECGTWGEVLGIIGITETTVDETRKLLMLVDVARGLVDVETGMAGQTVLINPNADKDVVVLNPGF